MTRLQDALDFRGQFDPLSPEYAAVDALIVQLIEDNTFTYADQYEYERYIAPRKDAHNA
jgi:hypothetical protein